MQKEYFAKGAFLTLKDRLDELSIDHVLIVRGRRSFIDSGAQKGLAPALENRESTEFCGFSNNPRYSEIAQGVELCRRREVETGIPVKAIVSIGGGSCIDVGKSINAFLKHPGLEQELVTGVEKVTSPLLPLIAVPTTCGSGSEATHFAVVYLKGKKYSLAAKSLLPNISILDSSLIQSLPPYTVACTGFDALSQATESFWAKAGSDVSRDFAEQAINILISNLLPSVQGCSTSREQQLLAANLAGKAINISKTTAPHALSYDISSEHKLPHGHAVALTLGLFFELHEELIKSSPPDKNKIAKLRFDELHNLFGVKSGTSAKSKWYELMHNCGLEHKFSSLNISKSDTDRIAESVNIERLENHPIKLGKKDLRNLLMSQLDS